MKNNIIYIAALFLFGLIACQPKVEEKPKPNFLFILVDDYGYHDLSVTGSKYYETPNIDRIATEGVAFTDYYAQQSCTAGRSSA